MFWNRCTCEEFPGWGMVMSLLKAAIDEAVDEVAKRGYSTGSCPVFKAAPG